MELELYTVVHPIGPDDYPGQPQGWRWAIHTDDQFHQVNHGCIYAGWEATQAEAELTLSVCLIIGRRMIVAAGGSSTVAASVLADCPLSKALIDELAVVG